MVYFEEEDCHQKVYLIKTYFLLARRFLFRYNILGAYMRKRREITDL